MPQAATLSQARPKPIRPFGSQSVIRVEAGVEVNVIRAVQRGVRSRADRERSLLTTGSGRFPVRGYAPLLSRIMDDQGERTPERRTSDV